MNNRNYPSYVLHNRCHAMIINKSSIIDGYVEIAEEVRKDKIYKIYKRSFADGSYFLRSVLQ